MQRFAVHTRSLALLVSCCVACNDDALSVEETQSVSSAVAEPVASTEPGFLTIACNPYCEDIKEGDKSLGPSPLVHHAMPAGSHTITLVAKDGSMQDVALEIHSGKTTAHRAQLASSSAVPSGFFDSSAEAKERYTSARQSLESKVQSGEATVNEIKVLRAICGAQGDSGCVAKCTATLKAKE